MAEGVQHPESQDVWPRALLIFGVGLLLFLVVAAVILYMLFHQPALWPPRGAAWTSNQFTPALTTTPTQDLATIRNRETSELNQLAWVDQQKGLARIPIDDAMEMVARNGLQTGGTSP